MMNTATLSQPPREVNGWHDPALVLARLILADLESPDELVERLADAIHDGKKRAPPAVDRRRAQH